MKNMDKRLLRITGLLFISFFFLEGVILAEELNPKGKDLGVKEKHEALWGELNLTAEQKEAIKAQRSEQRQKMKQKWEELKEKNLALKEELLKPEIDKTKLNQIVEEIKKIQGELLDYRVQKGLEMRQILTLEQYRLLEEKIKERQHRFRKRLKKE